MTEYTLSCFQGFRCLAGACPDTCCAGWEIDVDEQSRARYAAVPGALGEKLRESLEAGEDGSVHFRLDAEERCPFLREDHLCELYCALGADSLCEICREHPRFHNEYGDLLRESGFGLCCPEAARLLFAAPALPEMVPARVEDGSRALPGGAVPEETEAPAPLAPLLRLRARYLNILENAALPLCLRLGQLLTLAEKAQEALETDAPFPAETLPPPELPERADARRAAEALFALLAEGEAINSLWETRCAAARASFALPDEAERLRAFHTAAPTLAAEYVRLGEYLLYRYCLNDAVEGDVLTPAQLVCAYLAAQHRLDFALWLERGRFSAEERIESAALLSRQLEYSIENLDALRAGLIFGEGLPPDAARFLTGETEGID